MRLLRTSLMTLLVLGSLWGAPLDERVGRLASNVICTCPCPHVLKHCGDECGVAPGLLAEITAWVQEGKSDEEVYALYKGKYGTEALASPERRGFGWVAWILPFLALGAGGLVVLIAYRRLQGPPRGAQGEESESAAVLQEKYRKIIEEEVLQ